MDFSLNESNKEVHKNQHTTTTTSEQKPARSKTNTKTTTPMEKAVLPQQEILEGLRYRPLPCNIVEPIEVKFHKHHLPREIDDSELSIEWVFGIATRSSA